MSHKSLIALSVTSVVLVVFLNCFGDLDGHEAQEHAGVGSGASGSTPVASALLPRKLEDRRRLPAGRSVRGSVLIQHELGGEYIGLHEGTITIRGEEGVVHVPVIEGKFSVSFSLGPGEVVEVIEARQAESRLFMIPTRLYADSEDNVVRAFDYDGFFVQAYNDAGEILQELRFVTRPDVLGSSGGSGPLHPGNPGLCRKFADTVSGLIFLPMLSKKSPALWVQSPGYTWRLIRHNDVSVGKVLSVSMERAGSAVVNIGSFRRERGTCILLCSGDGQGRILAIYSSVDDGVVRLDGLPPSDYIAGLSIGPIPSLAGVESWSEVKELEPGGQVEFSVDFPPEDLLWMHGFIKGSLVIADLATLQGTPVFRQLRVDLYEDDPSVRSLLGKGRVDFVALQAMSMEVRSGSLDRYSWTLSSVPAGNYQARLAPFGLAQAVEVKAGQVADLEFILPPLAMTIVETVVDGKSTKSQGVSAVPLEGSAGTLLDAYEAESGDMVILSLPGKYDVSTRANGRAPARVSVQLHPGINHIAIDVPPTFNVVLKAVDAEGAELDLDWWAKVEVDSEGPGAGRLVASSVRRTLVLNSNIRSNARGVYYFSDPGTYTFTFPPLADGRSAKPLTVNVTLDPRESLRDVLVD